jgi:hypothetical protein
VLDEAEWWSIRFRLADRFGSGACLRDLERARTAELQRRRGVAGKQRSGDPA